MKKLLSLLLSVLMVLGTVTCLFIIPVTAETTEENTAEPVAETLPESIIDNKVVPEPSYYNYNNLNIISYAEKYAVKSNTLNANNYYQLEFEVNTGDYVPEGAHTLFAVYNSGKAGTFETVAGVRYKNGDSTNVETALIHLSSQKIALGMNGSSYVAKFEANTTYKYIFVFKTKEDATNLYLYARGTSGENAGYSEELGQKVEYSNVKLFNLSNTEWGNFDYNTSFMRYLVMENGNVFQRLYGLNAIDATTVGGAAEFVLYNTRFYGGNTYYINYDLRIASPKEKYSIADVSYMPTLAAFEKGKLDYTEDYKSIKDPSDTNTTVFIARTESQGLKFQDGKNPYSYNWTSDTSSNSTYIRRYNGNIFKMAYYDSNGEAVSGASVNTSSTSAIGRELNKNTVIQEKQGEWMTIKSEMPAFGQTLEEVATELPTSKVKGIRYSYDPTTKIWTFNGDSKNNLYVPAAEDADVGIVIRYLYKGMVYDLDNLSVNGSGSVPVEYKNIYGEADTLANTKKYTASMNYNALANKTTAATTFSKSDTLVFNGWYNGDELVSTDVEMEAEGYYENLKAVFTSKNILTYAGGFENYDVNKSLEADYERVIEKYKDFRDDLATNDNDDNKMYTRYYKEVPPTGDQWTGWDSGLKTSTIISSNSTNTDLQEKVIADIAETGGTVTDKGFTGFTYFRNFPTIVSSTTQNIYSSPSTDSNNKKTISITPYNGERMLRFQANARTGFRALEGLKKGNKYQLSFYVYNPYKYFWLNSAEIRTKADNTSNSKALAKYTEKLKKSTVTYTDKNGVQQTKENVSEVENPDHIQNWFKITLDFTATDTVLYLALSNSYSGNTSGYTYIDELTMVDMSEVKTAYNNKAALRSASASSTNLNGLRIYNSIEKSWVNTTRIVEFGSIAIRKELLNDAELTFGMQNAKSGVAYKRGTMAMKLWESNKEAYIFTTYLTNIPQEYYGKDYSIRTYAKDYKGNIYYGAIIDVCVFQIANQIDNNADATEVDTAAFYEFVNEETKDAYQSWCTENEKTVGSLYNTQYPAQ